MLADLIAGSPEEAARILRRHGYTVTKKRVKKPASKPDEPPPGWSRGAWEFHRAAMRAKSYGALDVTKLHKAASAACDRTEPIRPNPTFRAWMPYLPTGSGEVGRSQEAAVLEWTRLGVAGDVIHFETAEEYARRTRRSAVDQRIRNIERRRSELDDSRCKYEAARRIAQERTIEEMAESRKLLRECLEAGDRTAARRLAMARRELRAAFRDHLKRWGSHG